jgi:magnesium chelatase family protein
MEATSMNFAAVYTRTSIGIASALVTIEVHISQGLPKIHIVGLAKPVVKESIERVRSAIINTGYRFPNRRMTINLAPADLPKSSSRYDLPISIGILVASRQLPVKMLEHVEFLGELELSGQLRPVSGALPAALAAGKCGHDIILPMTCAHEAALQGEARVLQGKTLLEVCKAMHGQEALPIRPRIVARGSQRQHETNLDDVRGQPRARRALIIAASGGHHMLLSGPPGVGKTMLAQRMPTILPQLRIEHALELATIRSVAGETIAPETLLDPPFCAPHHTASQVAIAGGGSDPRPGSVSLASHGVLFLDELPEFKRQALEVLREPMEAGQIMISRAAGEATYPARFQLIATMNLCPCGYTGSKRNACMCTPTQIRNYHNRISGPLLDRIDLHIDVTPIPYTSVARQARNSSPQGTKQETQHQSALKQVTNARDTQYSRGNLNAHLTSQQLDKYCCLTEPTKLIMSQFAERLQLSVRACQGALRVARTIADIEGLPNIEQQHISEALSYRKSPAFLSE